MAAANSPQSAAVGASVLDQPVSFATRAIDLQIAHAHHRAGRQSEAEALCRAALARDPKDPHALHLLALMAQSQEAGKRVGNPFVGRGMSGDLPRLADLRRTLRQRMAASPPV